MNEYFRSVFNPIKSYKLSSIICHDGTSVRSGHYYSYVKHESKWCYYDNNIPEIKLPKPKELEKNAYVLIFNQKSE